MEQYCVSDVDVTLIRVYSTEDTIAEKERRKEERKREEERREEKRKSLTARLAEIGAKVWKEADKMAVDFGFDSQHWYYYILQNARLARSSRKPNRWNAFVAIMLESINARECC